MRHAGMVLMVAALALAAGCSQQSSSSQAQQSKAQQAANESAAQARLKLYRKLKAMNRPVMAMRIGREIVHKYPHTQAAAEMAKLLPATTAKAKAHSEQVRLANLWLYQVSPMAGGTQSTAAIDASEPAGSHVRLILRRQTKWGTSAFLYDNAGGKNAGFVCHKLCDIVMHFDGDRHVYRGYLPKGGEPAMFIKDYKSFIKRMSGAKDVKMAVTIEGEGKQTLVFETGGFDASKWQPLSKGGK